MNRPLFVSVAFIMAAMNIGVAVASPILSLGLSRNEICKAAELSAANAADPTFPDVVSITSGSCSFIQENTRVIEGVDLVTLESQFLASAPFTVEFKDGSKLERAAGASGTVRTFVDKVTYRQSGDEKFDQAACNRAGDRNCTERALAELNADNAEAVGDIVDESADKSPLRPVLEFLGDKLRRIGEGWRKRENPQPDPNYDDVKNPLDSIPRKRDENGNLEFDTEELIDDGNIIDENGDVKQEFIDSLINNAKVPPTEPQLQYVSNFFGALTLFSDSTFLSASAYEKTLGAIEDANYDAAYLQTEAFLDLDSVNLDAQNLSGYYLEALPDLLDSLGFEDIFILSITSSDTVSALNRQSDDDFAVSLFEVLRAYGNSLKVDGLNAPTIPDFPSSTEVPLPAAFWLFFAALIFVWRSLKTRSQ